MIGSETPRAAIVCGNTRPNANGRFLRIEIDLACRKFVGIAQALDGHRICLLLTHNVVFANRFFWKACLCEKLEDISKKALTTPVAIEELKA